MQTVRISTRKTDKGEKKRMIVAQYFDYFIIFSFIGWVYECIYCTMKDKHWQNRGFLFGPICPIYGCGVVGARIVFHLLPPMAGGTAYPVWEIFLICAVGSAIMEFVTSWILEKWFHAVWWDYSHVPLNLQGRICLPATCGFGLAGIVVVKFVLPFLETLPAGAHPIENEVLSLLFAVILGMDLALTVASLTKILDRMSAVEKEFNERMEAGYQTVQQGPAATYSAAKAAAQSAGETAVIAAMLASDTAKARAEKSGQEMSERVRRMMESFSGRERYHIRSIRAYRPMMKGSGQADSSERLRRLFASLQKSASQRTKKGPDGAE